MREGAEGRSSSRLSHCRDSTVSQKTRTDKFKARAATAREKPCWTISHSLLACRGGHTQSQLYTSISKTKTKAQYPGVYCTRSISGVSSGLPRSPVPTDWEVLTGFSGHFLICSTGCCHGDRARVSTGCHVNACSRKALKINGLLHGSLVFNFAVKLLKKRPPDA